MKKAVLWGKKIEEDFVNASENQLDDFLELLQYIQDNHIRNAICENTMNEAALWGWLYSKEQIELNDIKRELSRRLERAECVVQEEFDELLDKIGKVQSIKVLAQYLKRKSKYYISKILE